MWQNRGTTRQPSWTLAKEAARQKWRKGTIVVVRRVCLTATFTFTNDGGAHGMPRFYFIANGMHARAPMLSRAKSETKLKLNFVNKMHFFHSIFVLRRNIQHSQCNLCKNVNLKFIKENKNKNQKKNGNEVHHPLSYYAPKEWTPKQHAEWCESTMLYLASLRGRNAKLDCLLVWHMISTVCQTKDWMQLSVSDVNRLDIYFYFTFFFVVVATFIIRRDMAATHIVPIEWARVVGAMRDAGARGIE